MALGPGEDLRKKEEEELERRRSSAMDVDSETNTVEIGSTFEAPVNPAVPDRYRATIYYAGIVHTIHVSSIPWVLPGDPACLIHGRQHLFTPSLDPHKPNIPAPSIDNVHALFGEQRLPPTMKVGITAKISIPGDGHLARESIGVGITCVTHCMIQHRVEQLLRRFMGFTKRVVGRKKAREHDGEVFVEGAMNDEDSGSEEKEMYFSPLLLLEDCGDPIDPEKLNLDDRHECATLLFRFHHHGWTHGSFFPRNILMRRGDHADYPMERSKKDKRFRLIDFGRSRYLEDLAADDEKSRNEWDKTMFEEKSMIWHTMTLPNFT
uniref:Protein kinase domain-containing protein n=1 Tax=Moniliophthora roreri TaxID=221103 RepID=A0A0W0FNE2_MONRR